MLKWNQTGMPVYGTKIVRFLYQKGEHHPHETS
jgi:hypothetical protein